MAERSVVIKLLADVQGYVRAMRGAEKATESVGKKTAKIARQSESDLTLLARHARENEQAWTTVGTGLLAVGVAASAGVGAAVVKFAQFDKQMSAVQAATLASAQEMEGLRSAAIKAGQDTAYSAQEAAGGIEQLAKAGVDTKDIIGGGLAGALSLAAAGELEVADAAEIAASTMVQFGLAGEDVGTVADALAAGANKAQGSVQDLGLALSYAGVPASALGLTVEETTGVLGLFANAGITGEKAGTALRAMLVSLQNPSEKARGLMADLGVSAFDAQGEFIGMEGVAGVLQERLGGLTDEQRGAALATIFGNESLGAATTLYNGGARAVAQWTDAVSESGYAAEVAATRLDNLAGDVTILRGSLETALIGLGESGSGPLREVTQDLTTLVNEFASLPDGVQSGVLAISGLTGAAGLAGGAFMIAAPKAVEFYDALGRMGPQGANAQVAIKGLATVLTGPWGLAIAGATIAGGFLVKSWVDQKQAVETYRVSLDETTAALTENTRKVAAKSLQDSGALATARELGIAESVVTDAVLGNTEAQGRIADAIDKTREKARAYKDENGLLVANTESQESARALLGDLNVLERQIGLQAGTLTEAVAAQEELARATAETGDVTSKAAIEYYEARGELGEMQSAAEGVPEAIDPMSAALEESGNQADAAAERIEEWRKSMSTIAESFVQPLSAYTDLLAEKEEAERESAQATADSTEDASDSWEDHVSGVSVSLSEYAEALEEQNRNQIEWRDNLVKITQDGRADIAQELAAMGPEGADLVAAFANGTTAETERAAAAMREDMKFGREGVLAELDVMAIMARDGSRATARAISEELGIGAEQVQAIAERYGVNLASGINPLLHALGKDGVRPPRPGTGGVLRPFADGGVEDHTAQIANAGEWRLWAEPETGGEAYIPLAPAKRKRSLDIWKETGRRLGVPPGQDYAEGGFSSGGAVPKPPSTAPYRPPMSTAGDATMEKAYNEARAWVDANTAVPGLNLPPGSGSSVQALVAYGRALMAQGLRVSSNAALGRPPSRGMHSPTGYHYRFGNSGAIDVNSHAGESEAEKRRLTPVAADALRRGFGVQWLSPGHYNHLHIDVGSYRRVGNMSRYMGGNRAMAEGGILNPHVRDAGGPLLPGYTFNGTGASERTAVLAPGQRVVDATGPAGGSAGGRGVDVTIKQTVTADGLVAGQMAQQIAQAARVQMQDAIAANGLAGIATGAY